MLLQGVKYNPPEGGNCYKDHEQMDVREGGLYLSGGEMSKAEGGRLENCHIIQASRSPLSVRIPLCT